MTKNVVKPLEEMTVVELEKLYYLTKLQALTKVHKSRLYDNDVLSDLQGNVIVDRTIRASPIIDPLTPDMPQLFDGNSLNVSEGGMRQHAGASGLGATGVNISVPTGEIWEILAMYASFLCDATVISRTANLIVYTQTPNRLNAVPATGDIPFSPLTLTASQHGSIYVPGGGWVWDNDNGTITADAVVTLSPLPLYIDAGGVIKAAYSANGQAADASAIDIIYRTVHRTA
jgi:hypothetical protein